MKDSPALWGATVMAQLETLRADLKILNDIKQTALEAKAYEVMKIEDSPEDPMIDKVNGMISRRLDAMISLETTDEDDEDDDESESETPTQGGQ